MPYPTKMLTVSVGVAAYNAEERIEALFRSILEQETPGVEVREILVHCDDCSDGTVEACSRIRNMFPGKIVVIDNKERKGFALSALAMMRYTNTDIFVLLNDDIKLGDSTFIAQLVQPMIADARVGLTSGRLLPFPPRTFVEGAIVSTFYAYDRMRNSMENPNNQFTYDGASMALSRSFIESIKVPDPVSDLGNLDAFLYFSSRTNGFSYVYAREAVLFHRYPATLADYKRQVSRNNAQVHLMNRQFEPLSSQEYKKPTLLFLKCALIEFVKNPLGCAMIFATRFSIRARARLLSRKQNLVWDTADTSKEKIL